VLQEWCAYEQLDYKHIANADGANLVKRYLIWQYENGKYHESKKPVGFSGTRDVKRPGRPSKHGERMVCHLHRVLAGHWLRSQIVDDVHICGLTHPCIQRRAGQELPPPSTL